jgi:hypothetical protein
MALLAVTDSNRIKPDSNPPLVSNVGLDRLKTRIIGTEEFATAIRMP